MSDITKIKQYELEEILDFYNGVKEYGHIYHFPDKNLDEPFNKIMEGIEEIQQMIKDSFEM